MKEKTSVSEIVEIYLKKLIAKGKQKNFQSDNLIGVLKQYEDLTDEEIKELYMKGSRNA